VADSTLYGKNADTADNEESDISSEDEYYDEIDSEDVDSDGLDESLYVPSAADEDQDMFKQQDYIQL